MTEEEDIDKPTITYAEIDPKLYENENKIALENRRPELYQELMLYVEPWDYTKNTTSHDIVAAPLQYEPVVGDKEKNKEKITSLLKEAKRKNENLNLVVLPELSLTGPVDGKSVSDITSLAETINGCV